MASHPFLTDDAKQAVRRAIVDVEAHTSAEIVVTVRRVSGRYREADYLIGFAASLLALVGLLYLPPIFPLWTFVPNVVIGFVLGTLASSWLPWRRSRLTPRQTRIDQARGAALSSFVEGDYSALAGRQAVLVYVSLAERHVEVVADVGLRRATAEDGWIAGCRALVASVHPPDVLRFTSALRELGGGLAAAYPRAADDRNELPDEVKTL